MKKTVMEVGDTKEKWMDIRGYDITLEPDTSYEQIKDMPNKPFRMLGECGSTFLFEDVGVPGAQWHNLIKMSVIINKVNYSVEYKHMKVVKKEKNDKYSKWPDIGMQMLFRIQDQGSIPIQVNAHTASVLQDVFEQICDAESYACCDCCEQKAGP